MSSFRDFIRDFIGILFPGGFTLFILIWFIINVSFIFYPTLINHISGYYNNWIVVFILTAFSYIAGQLFRMKQLKELEKICTKSYKEKRRKKYFKKTDMESLDSDFLNGYQELEKKYIDKKDKINMDKIREEFSNHHDKFGIWEIFPYPWYMKFWRIINHTEDYNRFFNKFDEQGITKDRYFFHFCKNVVYEYSASFKEELVRQESLVRLFSGLFYSIRFSQFLLIAIALEHAALIACRWIGMDVPIELSPNTSCMIALVSIVMLFLFRYIYSEIIKRIRFMRIKELQIAFDSFYIVCKKEELNY